MKKEYFVRRVLIVALVLTLVASMAVFSVFSWYDRTARDNETGNILSYTQTGKVNNTSGVTVTTYLGTLKDGAVEYSETPVSGAIDVKAGQPVYFKSVVTDTANAGGAVVSLYIKDLSYASSLGEELHIGLVGPEKTYKEYSTSVSGGNYLVDTFCLEDNIFVENNGTVEVQWFIKPSAFVTVEEGIKPGSIYIAYN